MSLNREDSINRQREALTQILRDPLEQVASDCALLWLTRRHLENILHLNFSRIPYCAGLYALDTDGIQITENVCRNGIQPGFLGRNRSQQPYIKTIVPAWGFLLSDVYTSQDLQHPSFTALHVVRKNNTVLGYICVDFDLRDLPLTSSWFQEKSNLQMPFEHGTKAAPEVQPKRLESFIDKNLVVVLGVLEELLTSRGVFQCDIHFASSQVTICTEKDPFSYRLLGLDSQLITDSLQHYPSTPYPAKANIPKHLVKTILIRLQQLRLISETLYLRHASINIFNGMINLSFSCDGLQYLTYKEFLEKPVKDWLVTNEQNRKFMPA